MILVRLRTEHDPEIVLEGTEEKIIKEIHKRGLCDYHDAFFYERGKYENLGLGGEPYDYYSIYNNEEEMNRVLKSLKTRVVVGGDIDGHFHAISIDNRRAVIKYITDELSDHLSDIGEYALEEAEIEKIEDLMECDFESYEKFVQCFVQRGIMEITEVI